MLPPKDVKGQKLNSRLRLKAVWLRPECASHPAASSIVISRRNNSFYKTPFHPVSLVRPVLLSSCCLPEFSHLRPFFKEIASPHIPGRHHPIPALHAPRSTSHLWWPTGRRRHVETDRQWCGHQRRRGFCLWGPRWCAISLRFGSSLPEGGCQRESAHTDPGTSSRLQQAKTPPILAQRPLLACSCPAHGRLHH